MGRRGRSRSLATQPLPQPLPVARPIARDLLSMRPAAARRGGGPLFASSREKELVSVGLGAESIAAWWDGLSEHYRQAMDGGCGPTAMPRRQ